MVSLQWFWHSLHTSRSVVMLMLSSASPVRMELAVWATPSTTTTWTSGLAGSVFLKAAALGPDLGAGSASDCSSDPSALTTTSKWSASS